MGGGNGSNAGAGQFVQDLYKGVLPLNELAKSVGLTLPAFRGTPAATPPVVPAVPEPKLEVKIETPPRRS